MKRFFMKHMAVWLLVSFCTMLFVSHGPAAALENPRDDGEAGLESGSPDGKRLGDGAGPETKVIVAAGKKKKKKKVPVLLAVGGLILTGIVLVLFNKVKKDDGANGKRYEPKKLRPKKLNPKIEVMLTVSRGQGVEGTPGTGSTSYYYGEVVPYSYRLQPGYKEPVVNIDGQGAPMAGHIVMDANHELVVSALAGEGS